MLCHFIPALSFVGFGIKTTGIGNSLWPYTVNQGWYYQLQHFYSSFELISQLFTGISYFMFISLQLLLSLYSRKENIRIIDDCLSTEYFCNTVYVGCSCRARTTLLRG